MLMDKRNQTVAYERAECVRTIEYMRCMMEDSLMADRFVQIEKSDKNFNESVDMKENHEIMMNLKVETDEDKEEEIQRIVDATSDLSIDEMIGIQKTAGDYEMDAFTEGVNLQAKSSMRKLKRVVVPILKKMNKAIKKNNFGEAEKLRKQALMEFKAIKAEYKAINFKDDSISQTLFGYLLWDVCTSLKMILLVLISLPIAGLAGTIYGWAERIRTLIDLCNSVSASIKQDGRISITNLNTTKNKVDGFFDSTEKSIVDAEKVIEELRNTKNNK